MTIDRYTKAVLTVIAGCLLWICVTSAGVPLGAQMRFAASTNTTVQPVVIVGTGTLDRSGTVTFDYSRGRSEWSLPVTLAYGCEAVAGRPPILRVEPDAGAVVVHAGAADACRACRGAQGRRMGSDSHA